MFWLTLQHIPFFVDFIADAMPPSYEGGARKRRAVKVTGDTRVFEEGQLGEAPGGGSLSTYRELSSLATEMGQPDLLYKFMDLANHAAVLNSSRGAAFGWVLFLLVTCNGAH